MAQSRKKKILGEVQKKRRQRTLISLATVIALVAVIAVAVYVLSRTDGGNPNGYPYQCLPQEALFLHIHPWLQISIANVGNVTIPAAIGIVSPQFSNGIAISGSCFEPMHTHDSSGLIHIESPDRTNYTLGKFFEIWNDTYHTINFGGDFRPIVFSSTNILGYTSDQTHRVLLLVDGKNSTAFGSLVLNQYDYCSSAMATHSSPCYPTDVNSQGLIGDPYYGGQTYPYGTGHTIVIKYQ